MQRLELIMGRNIPDNGKVTDRMMNDFIKEYIIPFFDYGTFIDGEGLWKGELEQTKIFYLELPDSEVDGYREMFQQIAIKYKQAFNQESVLISQLDSKIAFVYICRIQIITCFSYDIFTLIYRDSNVFAQRFSLYRHF